MPYATPAEAADYHAPAKNAVTIRVESLLEDAADLVAGLAPAPEEASADYDSRAKRAELRLFSYLFDTGGYLSSKNNITAIGGGKGFRSMEEVERIVSSVMGGWFVPQPGDAAANVAYVSRFPS